jgi:hypothetical protein
LGDGDRDKEIGEVERELEGKIDRYGSILSNSSRDRVEKENRQEIDDRWQSSE